MPKRAARTDERFIKTFEDVFGEPVIKTRSVEASKPLIEIEAETATTTH
jgi:hypothetical protein